MQIYENFLTYRLRNFHSDYVAVCFHRAGVVAPVIV